MQRQRENKRVPRKKIENLSAASVAVGTEDTEYTLEGLSSEDALALFNKVNEGWIKEPENLVILPRELRPYQHEDDWVWSRMKQLLCAQERKREAERPRTLEEVLEERFSDPDGFQMGPMMRLHIAREMPQTPEQLIDMELNGLDMNMIVRERHGQEIICIVKELREKLPEAPKYFQDAPMILTEPFDLLILREKRREARSRGESTLGLCPSFHVLSRRRETGAFGYEETLAKTLSFIDSCTSLVDREGNPLSGYAVYERLKAARLTPEYGLTDPMYYSYWNDREKYMYLLKPQAYTPGSEER
jgi:hypothetical protein